MNFKALSCDYMLTSVTQNVPQGIDTQTKTDLFLLLALKVDADQNVTDTQT